MQGKVIALYITKKDGEKKREKRDEITLTKDGIVGDKFYAKDEARAILITSTDSYKLARESGIELPEGALGENILIDINPYHLLPGETLRVGELSLEITQNCTLCKGLSTLNSKLPKLLKNDRGVFAKIVTKTASIKRNDLVTI
jgi:MOSC domain-containing protein YiiM